MQSKAHSHSKGDFLHFTIYFIIILNLNNIYYEKREKSAMHYARIHRN